MGRVIDDEFRWSAGVGSASWVFFDIMDYPYPRYPDGRGGITRVACFYATDVRNGVPSSVRMMLTFKCE